jgi:hypothetical protein
MMNENINDAIQLAKQRWAQLHTFDLDDESWESLFSQFGPGDILQAIQETKQTRSHDPGKIYGRFEFSLARLAQRRAERVF